MLSRLRQRMFPRDLRERFTVFPLGFFRVHHRPFGDEIRARDERVFATVSTRIRNEVAQAGIGDVHSGVSFAQLFPQSTHIACEERLGESHDVTGKVDHNVSSI
jgi:hypothetical protein